MRRILIMILVTAGFLGLRADAQVFVGPGSTPQGDYLRGVGVAAMGMGQYNYLTAEADSIYADIWIRTTDYIRTMTKLDNQTRARNRIQKQAEHIKRFNAARDRVLNNPNLYDLQSGDALNALRMELGRYTNSELRGSEFQLSSDVVRRIPFKLDEEGVLISLPRILHSEKGWPVAFQDHSFDRERVEYDRAISHALGQFVEVEMQQEALARVRRAIDAIEARLKKRIYETEDFKEGLRHIVDLRRYVQMLGSRKAQDVIVDLDEYSGTTIVDLLRFMNDHKIGFAVPDRAREQQAYREIYAALDAQRDLLQGDNRDKKD